MFARIVILLGFAGAYLWGLNALNHTAQQSISNLSDLYTHPVEISAQFEDVSR